MSIQYKHILIIADIEGSSGCLTRRASRFLNPEWARACLAMSLDVNAVATALFEAGIETILIKDFHRTGYNLLPEHIHPRARVIHGYQRGPVIGLGDPGPAQAVMFLGMHAPSGSDGFLSHTLTSRISRLEVNGELMSEVQLFSASLFPYGIRPLFFSGCPTACDQAEKALPGLPTWPIRKNGPVFPKANQWRRELGEAAVQAIHRGGAQPYDPPGPFKALVFWRDEPKTAVRPAHRWRRPCDNGTVVVTGSTIQDVYLNLTRMAFLNRLTDRFQEPSLFLYHCLGRMGLAYVRWALNKRIG
jgi:D-amino peptidase